MIRPAITLFLIAAVSSAALAFTFSATNPKIIKIKEEERESAMNEIMPDGDDFEEKETKGKTLFLASSGGNSVGIIYQVSPAGYGGPITMLVGVSNGKVTAIDVLDQKETPGLGTLVDEGWFKEQFKGKSSKDKIEPKQDIDALVGATISSRAVAKGVKEALKMDEEK